MGLKWDIKSKLTLLFEVDGTLYPIAMNEGQRNMINLFVASVSQESEFKILDKAPVITTGEIVEKIEREYGLKVITE